MHKRLRHEDFKVRVAACDDLGKRSAEGRAPYMGMIANLLTNEVRTLVYRRHRVCVLSFSTAL